MRQTIAFVIGLFFSVINPTFGAVPTPLTGIWENEDTHGTITVIVTKAVGEHVEGIMQLTGSEDCVDPIVFRGTTSPNGIAIIADAPGICGHNGVLSAEARAVTLPKDHDGHYYVGTFSYTLFGLVWKKGTFWLDVQEIKTK